jgi:hypothetical protein
MTAIKVLTTAALAGVLSAYLGLALCGCYFLPVGGRAILVTAVAFCLAVMIAGSIAGAAQVITDTFGRPQRPPAQ